MTITHVDSRRPTPHSVRLQGDHTHVDLTVTLNATCSHGHQHTLHVTDISDMEDAARQQAEWAGEHVDTCTGVAVAA